MNVQQAIEVSNRPHTRIDWALRTAQGVLCHELYRAVDDHAERERLNAAYTRIRDSYEARFPDAHCACTDPDAYEVFANLYKEENGFRCRSHRTGREVRAWLNDYQAQQEAIECGVAPNGGWWA